MPMVTFTEAHVLQRRLSLSLAAPPAAGSGGTIITEAAAAVIVYDITSKAWWDGGWMVDGWWNFMECPRSSGENSW